LGQCILNEKYIKMVCGDCGENGHREKTCLVKFENIERVNNKNEECSICLSKVNKPRCKTKCNHVFHITCLKEWLKMNTTCPLCRKSISDDKDKEEVLIILVESIMERIQDMDDTYLLMNPGLIEDVVESYFQNENLI